ncbi:MAG: hypothetical protein ACI4LO_10025 [Anaerovoracaceae bacterium]
MNIDDKMIQDLARQVGIGGNSAIGRKFMEETAKKFSGKSDDQVLEEIMKLKQVIQKDKKAYSRQIEAVKALKPMMNSEQQQKLEQLLSMLED